MKWKLLSWESSIKVAILNGIILQFNFLFNFSKGKLKAYFHRCEAFQFLFCVLLNSYLKLNREWGKTVYQDMSIFLPLKTALPKAKLIFHQDQLFSLGFFFLFIVWWFFKYHLPLSQHSGLILIVLLFVSMWCVN